MKKILLVLAILVVSFATMLSAQTADQFTGSLLWKVSGKGLDKPSYVFGTHHLASVNFVDSVAGLRAVMDEVEQVAGEILMSDMAAAQADMMQKGAMPADQSYKTILDEAAYNKLDSGLKSLFGAGLEQFGGFKPGMINSLVSIVIYAQLNPNFNMTKHVAIDDYIQKYAIENAKPVLGLETVADQIYALFDAEPLKDQAEVLACSMGHIDLGKEALLKLNQYYREANLKDIYTLAFNDPNDPCPASEQAEYALNKQRNDRWLEKLPAIMTDKSTLVAVGTLHLAGEEGLLYQLSKMGYTVEAVK